MRLGCLFRQIRAPLTVALTTALRSLAHADSKSVPSPLYTSPSLKQHIPAMADPQSNFKEV